MGISEESKNKKIIRISILVVIIVAIIIWMWGYFSLKKIKKEKIDKISLKEENKVEKLNEQEKKNISSKISQIINLGYKMDEKVKIEDSEKVIYENTPEDIEKDFYTNNAVHLKNRLEKESLTKEEKNYIILKQMTPTRLTINAVDIKNETIKELVKQDENLNIRTDILQINAKDVEEKYKEFFKGSIEHKTIKGCPSFYYDKINQVYYYLERCGQNSLTNTYASVYKSNYQKVKDEITVETTIAYIEEITEQVENDRKKEAGIYIAKDNNFKEEKRLDVGTEFKVDETNKEDFTTYKFTFKKENNNYIFDSIRKK